MRGVFVDIIGGKLLDITENNKEDFISRTVMNMCHYENIRVVTMDMANGYKSKVQDVLPNATIVVDKYHVFQDLHRQIATVKKAIMPVIRDRLEKETDPQKALNMQKAYNIAACNAYLFKFGRKKLVEKKDRIPSLAEVCDVFPEFNHLRLIKEGFERIYEESVTREDAEILYKEWVKLIPPVSTNKISEWEQTYGVSAELFAAMRTFLHTTKNWHEEIFNYFNPGCNYTNATTEGINSLLQRINSMGSGYGFSSLRAHALYQNIVGGRYKYSLSKTFASKSVKDLSGYPYTYCTPLHLFDERTVTSINGTMEIEKIDLCDDVDPDWFIFYD